MKKFRLLIFLGLYVLSSANAQNASDRALILSQTDVAKLKTIVQNKNSQYLKSLNLNQASTPNQIINKKGELAFLSGFDESGAPVYDHDDNLNSAISIRTNQIWQGGLSGLNLDGTGIELGLWEATGLPMSNHQELYGKIINAESAVNNGHATHTAGTMVGKGVNQLARGMASGATIIARVSNNDEAELAEFALTGGLLSNHSYSSNDPEGKTAQYGVYTANSAEWDELLYAAPFLLACKSAGNSRNDGVNLDDWGHDLLFTIAVSKNVLTVGAVNNVPEYKGPGSVEESSFSNWGPTDDWRIKPDIMANGIGIFSANNISTTSYIKRDGTSMSSPAVAGTAALLQQHYHNLNKVYMRAATLKALLIATTDEVGAFDGPDFKSGWGLLNAQRAASVITENGNKSLIKELSLSENSKYTHEIIVDGLMPLTVSIVWNDPAGKPVTGIDNQTPMLVNDLDIVVSGNNNIYKPWVLSPNSTSNNFADAATKGDNFRDNVERIDIPEISAGKYQLTVSHKKTLFNGKQDFSLVINGISQQLTANKTEVLAENIIVYPVPSKSGFINIVIPEKFENKPYEIQIIDLSGKILKRNTNYINSTAIDVAYLPSGFYLLKIIGSNFIYTERVLIN